MDSTSHWWNTWIYSPWPQSRAAVTKIAVNPVLRLSSMIMVRDAARVGVGAARLPISLVSRDVAAGTLMLCGDVDGPEIALWTLYPSRRLQSARVSAFLEHLKAAFPRGTPNELAAYVGGMNEPDPAARSTRW